MPVRLLRRILTTYIRPAGLVRRIYAFHARFADPAIGRLFSSNTSKNAAEPTPGGPVLFEGARLIVGDGNAPIEDSAFLMENNKFTKIGKKGEIQPPEGAAGVRTYGRTVMPALIDTHTHLGWAVLRPAASPRTHIRKRISLTICIAWPTTA